VPLDRLVTTTLGKFDGTAITVEFVCVGTESETWPCLRKYVSRFIEQICGGLIHARRRQGKCEVNTCFSAGRKRFGTHPA
jgi:hypothetical protein